jgi:diguanylate cyclase (GGDEF)-like protein
MENSAGEVLYRELSYRELVTSSIQRSSLKIIWLMVMVGAIVLTVTGQSFDIHTDLFSIDSDNLPLHLDPSISLCLLSLLWFGLRWSMFPLFAATLLQFGLYGDVAQSTAFGISHLIFFCMVAQTYHSLPLTLDLRHLHAWFTFLLVVFTGCSMGAGVDLLLNQPDGVSHYQQWIQWWMSNWLNGLITLPLLLFLTPYIVRQRQKAFPSSAAFYPRPQATLSAILLIAGILLYLCLSYALGLDLASPFKHDVEKAFKYFSDVVFLMVCISGFIMMSLVYLGYHIFRHWSFSLENKAAQAIQSNEAKSHFLSRMTHELRTPLNAIIGLTRLALGSTLTQSQREHINKIRTSASLLNSVINELLDYSKIEANKLELEFTAFALEEVVNRVAGVLSPRCSEKKIAFIVDLSPDIPRFVLGDPLRVEQILLNLLSNAIKFTSRGHVLLRITAGSVDDAHLKLFFEIIDTGSGIESEHLPELFKPFMQTDRSVSRRFGGTGLGLAISKQLVGLMGGHIQVSSEVGVGTEFTFSLQVGYRTDSLPGSVGFVCNKRWLLLHNQPDVAKILTSRLQDIGGTVYELGHELIIQEWLRGELTEEFPSPDMLLISYRIGAMDGITLLRKLRAIPAWKNTPVLFLYPQSEEESYRTLLSDDIAAELLPLPFYGAMLNNAIMSVLGFGARTSITRLPANDWFDMLHDINVLLVEDNAINRQVALETLNQVGVKVHTAVDGKEGIEKASKGKFDLVLMDVDLPEIDGITATYWLRNQGYGTPILAMTAFDDPKERERCLKAGMNDFMIKPFEPDTLYSLIYRWTVGKGQSAELIPSVSSIQPAIESELPSNIALDVILGFSRVGNNPQLYQQILSTFRDEYSDQGRELLAMVERENWPALERVAHNLKSVARYIGADSLSLAASELEGLLRRQEARSSRAIMAKKLVANIHILLMAVFDIIKSIPVISEMDSYLGGNDDVVSVGNLNKKQSLPRVLVVDDELIHRQMLCSILQQECEVLTVSNGAQALEFVFSQPVDLILLDMVMPDIRGDEVMRQLRSHPATSNIDVVIISARNDVEDEETGFLMGALDYITKPFHPTIVQARVKNVLHLIQQRHLLDQMAHMDGLTGIPNRRKFEQIIASEWARHQRASQPLSLAILDVDHFKRFNDTFGHASGDEVLKAVAGAMRDMLRRTGDFAARLGGEEFVLVFSGSDATSSAAMADNVRQAMEEIELPVGKITVSIGGVTLIPEHQHTPETIMEIADKLLYEAKQNGRNRVCWQSQLN